MEWTVVLGAATVSLATASLIGGVLWWGLSGRFDAIDEKFESVQHSLDRDATTMTQYVDAHIKAVESMIDAKAERIGTQAADRINGKYLQQFAEIHRRLDNLLQQ